MFCIVQRVIIVETNIENILLLWGRGRLNFPVKGVFCFGVRFMSGILGSLGGGICQLRVDVFGLGGYAQTSHTPSPSREGNFGYCFLFDNWYSAYNHFFLYFVVVIGFCGGRSGQKRGGCLWDLV